MSVELRPEVFTADYVGEPGQRAFYLQVRGDFGVQSFVVEKQQVAVLGEKLREVLLAVDADDTVRSATPARDPALGLVTPPEPLWRVGTMGLAYEEEGDSLLLFLQEVEADDDLDLEDDGPGVRIVLRRHQARAFVLHALAVVGEGRPLCQLCGLPMDPDGHACPASNGHRALD